AVTMEGNTEVVSDILAVRSADLVSDPATNRGLFESNSTDETPLSILDLAETLKGDRTMDVTQAILDAVNGTSTPAAKPTPSAPQVRVMHEGKELPGEVIQQILDACNG